MVDLCEGGLLVFSESYLWPAATERGRNVPLTYIGRIVFSLFVKELQLHCISWLLHNT